MIELSSGIGGAILFIALSFFALWIAKRNGFFIPIENKYWRPRLLLWHVVVAFAIYFACAVFVPALLSHLIPPLLSPTASPIALFSWMNIATSALIFAGLSVLFFSLNGSVRSAIWKSGEAHQPLFEDAKLALLAWVFSFPIVLGISQILDLFILVVFNVSQLPDQAAVYFVKMTLSHPLYFTLAVLSIILFAPLVEEFLFRGFLQTFIRRHLGPNQAILITSLCFSLFHFSPEQKLGNLPIIGSLFALALFLGYLYERQKSLFAPICLHALFNTISIINLYFLGGAPRGAL